MSRVDLHLHLLPGVDDGARTTDESLSHARRLVADDVRQAVVTPHVGPIWPVEVGDLPAKLSALRRALAAEGIPLELRLGAELHARWATRLSDLELDSVAHGPPGARWVLLEVPFEGIDAAFVATCEELRERGFSALVAHPERAAGFIDEGLRLLRPALNAGALLQVNVDSLLGRQGQEAQAAGGHLVRSGLAYVVASDGHPGTRHQTLRQGVDALLALGVPPLQARRLVADNPAFLLRHGVLARVPGVPAVARSA